jgi:histidinol dehydrogenase
MPCWSVWVASETVRMDSGPAALAAELRSLVPAPESVSEAVGEIIQHVRQAGDSAVNHYSERFDTGGEPPPPLRVAEEDLVRADQALDPAVRSALLASFEHVREVAGAVMGPAHTVLEHPDRVLTVREEPLRRGAVYVPGGRAPYPSTVVMGVAAAQAAGVQEIVVCSPPPVNEVILGACRLMGVTEAYRMGGAQAIAALAYGTESVRAVDVIVGPGNVYVQEAKRQVSGSVAIDSFAGPSDLLVIVEDDVSDLEPIALDLLAQSEHGPGTLVIGVSTSPSVLERLAQRVDGEADHGAVIRLVHAPTPEEALALAEEFAPEHLQLAGERAEALAPRITRAGCLFVGVNAGTAFGDYIVGSNHVLPTNGSARFSSGLSAAQFRRRFTEVRIRQPDAMAQAAAALARAEGFELHAQSMEARIRDNRRP